MSGPAGLSFWPASGPIRGPGSGASWTLDPVGRAGRAPLRHWWYDGGPLPAPDVTVATRSWGWYSDAATDGAMVPLAAEQTVPTLTGAQMQNGIVRLRVQVAESAGAAVTLTDLRIQMSVNDSTWQEIQAQTPVNNLEGIWFRHAAGAATNGATIGSQLLTGTTASGIYIEDKISDPTLGAYDVREFDFAVYVHWPRPDTTVRFRLVYGAGPTVVPAQVGSPQIQVRTSTAADRPYTITALDPDSAQQTCRELRFGAWPRLFWDPGSSLWWFFTVQYNSPRELVYFTWSGTGAWSAPQTVTFATDGHQSRNAVWVTGGKVYAMFGSSSTTRGIRRGVISGSSITWDTEQTITQASDRHRHITVDDGGFVWIGGTTASTGVWARRATSTDSVTAFQAVKTAADASVISGDIFAMVGLTSDKALCVWRSGSVLKSATVTDAGGFSAVTTVNATAVADDEDWGMVRDPANGLVYVAHTDSTTPGGNWVLRVFNVGAGTWSTTTNSPGVSGQTSDNDGLPMTLDDTGGVYICGTFPNSEGGQDRKLRYVRYSGGGTGGTWGALTDLTPAGSRVNGDHITTSPVTANNKALFLWEVNDDGAGDVPGTGFTVEFHFVTLANIVAGAAKAVATLTARATGSKIAASSTRAAVPTTAQPTLVKIAGGAVRAAAAPVARTTAAKVALGAASSTAATVATITGAALSNTIQGAARAIVVVTARATGAKIAGGAVRAPVGPVALFTAAKVALSGARASATAAGQAAGAKIATAGAVRSTSTAVARITGQVPGGLSVRAGVAVLARITGIKVAGGGVGAPVSATARATSIKLARGAVVAPAGQVATASATKLGRASMRAALAVIVRTPSRAPVEAWSWYLRRTGAWQQSSPKLDGVHPTSTDVT